MSLSPVSPAESQTLDTFSSLNVPTETLTPVGSIFQMTLENSIIPMMDQMECLKNLPRQKFSTHQWEELTGALSHQDERIRLVTYNILFNLFEEGLAPTHHWENRSPRMVAAVREMNPDILCVQELYQAQLKDLLTDLGDTYAFFSRSEEMGELNGVFYRKDRFNLLDKEVYPFDYPSDIGIADNLTRVTLQDKKTGKQVTVLNTHFPFNDLDAREKQARFVAKLASETLGPVVFAGDLNTFPARLELPQLPFLDGDYIHRILTEGDLRDAKERSLLGHLGPLSTFTNDGVSIKPFMGTGAPGVFLDHIYVSNDVDVLLHGTQSVKVGGEFPSDHMPLIADFLLR